MLDKRLVVANSDIQHRMHGIIVGYSVVSEINIVFWLMISLSI